MTETDRMAKCSNRNNSNNNIIPAAIYYKIFT